MNRLYRFFPAREPNVLSDSIFGSRPASDRCVRFTAPAPATGTAGDQRKPATRWGWYAFSRDSISESSSLTSTAATASSRWCDRVAPTIGASTTGLASSHANAPGRGRSPACRPHRSPRPRSTGRPRCRGSDRTRRFQTVTSAPPMAGPGGRGPAGSKGWNRRLGRHTGGASPAPPPGRGGCSGSAC